MKFVIRTIITAFALVIVDMLFPGITISGFYVALIAAFLLGILNAVVRPILVILTLPVTIVTLGLFIFVINTLIFLFVASFVDGFHVAGFWTGLFGSIVVSIISSIANKQIS